MDTAHERRWSVCEMFPLSAEPNSSAVSGKLGEEAGRRDLHRVPGGKGAAM